MYSIPSACRRHWACLLNRLLLFVGCVLVPWTSLTAQEGGEDPVQERHRAAGRAAFESAMVGDFDEAERQLRAGLRGAEARRPPETELTEDLAMLALRLRESGEATAAIGVSERAITALGRVQKDGGVAESERIRAILWIALLYSKVLHDEESARAIYQEVLKRDPENLEAQERLAVIALTDTITEEKIKEQRLIAEHAATARVSEEAAP